MNVTTATMIAVRMHTTGSPDVLVYEEVPLPEPGPREVLIRVHAAGVNPVDCKRRRGVIGSRDDLPLIPGYDVSGMVAACGPGVRDCSEGEEVFAYLHRYGGGYAEFAVAALGEFVRKPAGIDHVHAAAAPLAALTAWQGLFDHGRLRAGQTVLIHGAGGGVGHIAVQLAREHGARVVATAAAADLDVVSRLGADIVIDFAAMPFQKVVREVDLVFDLVAGVTQRRSWPVLREGGLLVSALGRPERVDEAPAGTTGRGFKARADAAQLEAIRDLVERGRLSVHVTRTLPLVEARHAHDLMESQHNQGKTVLVVR